MRVIRQLFDLFEAGERWHLVGLGACMIGMAVLEMIGVASIMPFMQVVSDPDLVHENHWLSRVYETLGFSSTHSFLVFLGLALLGLIALSSGFNAFTTWLMYRFAALQNHRVSMRLLARYLARPYSFYLVHNTAGLSKNILSEVQTVITGVMLAALRLVARGLVALMIVALLAYVDIRLSLLVSVVLGGAYALIFVLLRRKQRRLGEERFAENSRRFRVSGEALTGIKDVKVLGREHSFLTRFRNPSLRYCRATASNQIVSKMPRYALETIAFSGIVLIVLYSLQVRGDVDRILPVLSLYAFAAYRLLPALNEVFMSAIQIRFNRPALEDLHRDLTEEQDLDAALDRIRKEWSDETAIPLERALALRDVSFTYPGASVPSLRNVDLEIQRGQVVGLVGETGAGKTTMVDLILGLLHPTMGAVEVDGTPLSDITQMRAWRRSCGYVPQQIFLSDDTIEANIAFGIPSEEIDHAAVVRAANTAQIDAFIRTLPDGYDTVVGERGIRLSGGQRQRIGIARALYHDPQVLVMDEATNSLDGATEAAVMEMIHLLGREKTLVVIAHRLSTVKPCDVIHVLQEGEIVASDTYDGLARFNTQFRTMAGLETHA